LQIKIRTYFFFVVEGIFKCRRAFNPLFIISNLSKQAYPNNNKYENQ